MTHDELLDKVELTLGTYISRYYGSKKDVELRSDVIDSLQALRAVVELHKPWAMETGPEDDPETKTVMGCSCIPELPAFLNPWPCPTIQAIEKELG